MCRVAFLVSLFALSPSSAQLPAGLGGLDKPPTSFAEVAKIDVKVSPEKAKPGELVTVKVTVTPEAFFWTYPSAPAKKQTGQNTIKLPKPGDLIFVGPVVDPPGTKTHKSSE